MKLWIQATFYAVSLLILSGCVAKPIPKKDPIIDESLPTVKLTKNGTIADINAIALEWSSFSDQRVKGIYIYKITLDGSENKKGDYYDTVDNRFTTHYLDKNIKPDTKYNYYFKTYSDEAESVKSETALISSLEPMDSVTWVHSIQNMPRSAKIIWRPHTNQKVKSYLIQRRTLKADVWTDLTTVYGRLSAEYIDTKLKDEFTYIYRIRVITYDLLTSKPSKEVKIITKALPQSIQNTSATTKLAKKIEIKWEQTQTKDFLTYRVYRSSDMDGSYKLISELKNNLYVDDIQEDGKVYFYRISVVDGDGLESIHDKYSVQGRTLIKPTTPALVEAKLVNEKIKISWTKSDSRVKSYIVQKRYKKSLFDELVEEYEDIKGLEFIDSEIQPDTTYYYKVFSVDANSIKSEPSMEVMFKTDKIIDSK